MATDQGAASAAPTPAEHAATVREKIQLLHSDAHYEEADEALLALVALADRATELERERENAMEYGEAMALRRVEAAAFAAGPTVDYDVYERERERAERAETALRRVEEEARQGKIHSEGVRVDQKWPVHQTIHRFTVIRQIARAALGETASRARA